MLLLLFSCLHVQCHFRSHIVITWFLFAGKFSALTETVLVVLTLTVEVDLFLSSPVGHDLSRSKIEMSTGHKI